MSAVLGLAAGVMIMVSFVELFNQAVHSLGFGLAQVAFFSGMAVMFLLDILIPHEYMAERAAGHDQSRLMKTGMLVAVGLMIHNFPEGMATFVAALKDPQLGLAVAVGIAIHNIPEGVAVSAPIYAATGSRIRAFLYSFISGAAEPLGAIIAAILFLPYLKDEYLGWAMGWVAGLMVFISLDELIPASREYGFDHISILAASLGMAVMGLSLYILV
jgi:ZIP family zinc transporter